MIDPILGFVLIALCLMGTAASGLVALYTGLSRNRVPIFSAPASAVFLLALMVVGPHVPPGRDDAELARVHALHSSFAPALERYREEHGRYPETLEQAGIATPQTRYGPLRYRVWTDSAGTRYEVSFGDYHGNGFVSSWGSLSGEWALDT